MSVYLAINKTSLGDHQYRRHGSDEGERKSPVKHLRSRLSLDVDGQHRGSQRHKDANRLKVNLLRNHNDINSFKHVCGKISQ